MFVRNLKKEYFWQSEGYLLSSVEPYNYSNIRRFTLRRHTPSDQTGLQLNVTPWKVIYDVTLTWLIRIYNKSGMSFIKKY
jgi:hypothetical protein